MLGYLLMQWLDGTCLEANVRQALTIPDEIVVARVSVHQVDANIVVRSLGTEGSWKVFRSIQQAQSIERHTRCGLNDVIGAFGEVGEGEVSGRVGRGLRNLGSGRSIHHEQRDGNAR